MIEPRWKGRIVQALRRLSFSYPPRLEAKAKQYKAPATYECQSCKVWIYEGQSEKNFKKVSEENPDKTVIMGTVNMDHIKAIVSPNEGFVNWDIFINRMFVDASGFQALCDLCHASKTQSESLIRKQSKSSKK